MSVYNGIGFVNYSTKNFSDCSDITRLEFSALNFRIKVRMVNDNSNYTINVHQEYSEVDELWIMILCSIAIVILTAIMVASIIIACCVVRKQQRSPPQIVYTQEDFEFRNEHISRCLENMSKTEYKKIRTRFDQSNCIICFDDFEPTSEVCMTNECNHVFHFDCLKSWFDNVRISRDLTCPICNTVITDTSEVPKNDYECKSDEVSESAEFETPNQILLKYQDQLTNYVALMSRVDTQGSNAKLQVEGNQTDVNQDEKFTHHRMHTQRIMLTYQESDSD